MAKITLDLNRFKASGVYTVEFDASERIVISTQTIRLVVGFSRKGPFNAPVFLRDIKNGRRIFGEIDKFLESKGSFFHRALETCLTTGPIFALNLLPLNNVPVSEGGDATTYRSFALAADDENGNVTKALLASFFNQERFWFPDAEYLQATVNSNFANNGRLFNIVNVGQTPSSVIVRKSVNARQYDITAEDYYGPGNIPDYVKSKDYLSDYFIDVIIVEGDWTNLSALSIDPLYSTYFDERGIKLNRLNEFLGADFITLIASFSGCIIPDFLDNNGSNQSIETIVNNAVGLTGIFLNVNREALSDYENSTYKIDLVGHSLINTSDDTIDFLSYNTPISSELLYGDPAYNSGNPFQNSSSYHQYNAGSTTPYIKSVAYGNNRTGNWFNTLVIPKPAPSDTVFTPSIYEFVQRSLNTNSLIRTFGTLSAFVINGNDANDYVKVENVIDTGSSLEVQLSSPLWYPGNASPATVDETFASVIPSVADQIALTPFSTLSPAVGDFILVEAPGVKKYYEVLSWNVIGPNILRVQPATSNAAPYYQDNWCADPSALSGDTLVDNFGSFIQPTDIKVSLYTLGGSTDDLIPDLGILGNGFEVVFNPDIVYTRPNSLYAAPQTVQAIPSLTTIRIPTGVYLLDDVLGALIYSPSTPSAITAGTRVVGFTVGATDTITLSKPLPSLTSLTALTDDITFRHFVIEAYPGSKLANNVKSALIINGDKVNYAGGSSTFNYLGVIKNYGKDGLSGTNDTYSTIGYGLVGSGLQEYDDTSLSTLTTTNWVGPDETWEIGGIAAYAPVATAANIALYSSVAGNLSENVTIMGSLFGGGKKFKTNASNGNKIEVGEFLVNNDINNPLLTRVISKVKQINPSTGAIEYVYEVLQTPAVNSLNQVTRYRSIQNFCDRLQFTYLEGFKLTSYHLPNKSEAQVDRIYSVLENTNLAEVLKSRDVISYRYIVDTFNNGLAPGMGSKQYLARLAKNRQKCMALLNAPSIAEFQASTDPRFTELPNPQTGNPKPVLNTEYIATGGNLSLGPSFRFTLPDEDNGAKFIGVFSPNVILRESGKNISIPPAAHVSNNYIRKFINGTPYGIVAGPRRGVLSDPKFVGLEYDFLLRDREFIEPIGINPIVIVRNVGPMIYANQTAYQRTLSAFNNLHVRDLLITVEEAIEDVLAQYLFEFNDAATRLEIRTIVENYLDTVRNAGGIYDFQVVMDESNNTPEIIDQNFGILDVGIEPARGLQKFVNRVTVLKTGAIASGGFSVA
jgi:hypothetical protein